MKKFSLIFMSVLILSLVGLPSCRLKYESAQLSESSTETSPFRAEIPEDKRAALGHRVRLAALDTKSWHPLEQTRRANTAIIRLVYRGLFFLDSNEHLAADLAESAAFSEDGKQLTIGLRKDLSYADGRRITAEDCAASLVYYRRMQLQAADDERDFAEVEVVRPATKSGQEVLDELAGGAEVDSDAGGEIQEPEADLGSADFRLPGQLYPETDLLGLEALRALESVEILDTLTLRLHFVRYVPEMIYRLDFPILPAADLEKGLETFPPTGSFAISQRHADGSLELTSRDQSTHLQSIEVRTYSSEEKILRALSDDQVDIVYLEALAFHNFSSRRDLRNIPTVGTSYHLLLPGNDASSLFQNLEVRDAFFRLWLKHPEYAGRISGLEPSPFPLRANNELWPYVRKLSLKAQNGPNFHLDELTSLRMVAPNRPLVRDHCRWIRDLFFELNIDLAITYYDETDLSGVVKGGDYDLAYLVLDLDYPFEPASFYTELAYYRSDFSEAMAAREEQLRTLADFQRQRLSILEQTAFRHDILERIAQDYFELLTSVKFYGLGYVTEGMLLGPRVLEYFTPLPNDPYYHLKEIHVWPKSSSQSSSP